MEVNRELVQAASASSLTPTHSKNRKITNQLKDNIKVFR